uniref:EF-hand domain-containing protein n=2 Tax=Choreotrichia TaxID=141411 RepID=A0A7S3T4P0_9SPIT
MLKDGKFFRRKKELREDQLHEIEDSFELFDKDGTGVIDTDELWVALRALGSEPKKSEIKALVGEVDVDGTGQIDFDGYLKIILNKLAERPSKIDIEKAFRLFDGGAKGEVCAADLRRIADQIGEQISDEEIAEMIKEADSSGTGAVNLDEFIKIVTSYAQHYDGEK